MAEPNTPGDKRTSVNYILDWLRSLLPGNVDGPVQRSEPRRSSQRRAASIGSETFIYPHWVKKLCKSATSGLEHAADGIRRLPEAKLEEQAWELVIRCRKYHKEGLELSIHVSDEDMLNVDDVLTCEERLEAICTLLLVDKELCARKFVEGRINLDLLILAPRTLTPVSGNKHSGQVREAFLRRFLFNTLIRRPLTTNLSTAGAHKTKSDSQHSPITSVSAARHQSVAPGRLERELIVKKRRQTF
jgi:hypothetical protein